jgi:hypothetical protein
MDVSIIPPASKMPLTFSRQIRGWDLRRNVVNFLGEADGSPTPCEISMEALVVHFGAGRGGKKNCLEAFDRWRAAIEQKASAKHLGQDNAQAILLRAVDFS